ncbi:MAG: hypothetical protein HRU36_03580 [Rickettsiales bacterium]|nr:hypothetical protein [Rickettsiales bacterium]
MNNQNLFSFIFNMIMGTPSWVWFIFGYLLFVGIKATTSRIVYLPKLLIIPIVLTGTKYKAFMNATIAIWSNYLVCFLIGILVGFKFAESQKIKVVKSHLKIELSGSYSTLIILISFFTVKYVFGYLYATHQGLYKELIVFEIGISGIFSGYFLGKAIKYLSYYLRN